MIYVSELLPAVKNKNWKWDTYAYLMADTEEELIRFATHKLGLREEWIQRTKRGSFYTHFDITENKRNQAIRLGAKQIKIQQYLRREL